MQAPAECFQGFRCSDFVWELVPVDDSPGEEGVPAGEFNVRLGSLTSGANLTEFQCEKTLVNHKYFKSHLR